MQGCCSSGRTVKASQSPAEQGYGRGGREEEGEGNEYVCVVAVLFMQKPFSRMTVMGVILLTMMTMMTISTNPSKMTLKHRVIID